jgi:hypothetical protein
MVGAFVARSLLMLSFSYPPKVDHYHSERMCKALDNVDGIILSLIPITDPVVFRVLILVMMLM